MAVKTSETIRAGSIIYRIPYRGSVANKNLKSRPQVEYIYNLVRVQCVQMRVRIRVEVAEQKILAYGYFRTERC